MPIKTNRELVAALLDVVNKHRTLYVMGCFGAPLTGGNVSRYCTNHDYNKKAERTAMIKAAADKSPPVFGFDCVCLIKGLLWGWTGDGSKTYGGASYAVNGVPDISADQMITKCAGLSTDFSKIEVGEAVWLAGHIGVYIGNGKAIECTPSWDNKVQITAVANIGKIAGLNARTWTKHGKLPYIVYEGATSTPSPAPAPQPAPPAQAQTLKVGDIVTFTGSTHYASANATTGPSCKPGVAKITQVYPTGKHPYHLVAEKGGGSTVHGWVDAARITKASSTTATPAPTPAGNVVALAVKHASAIIFSNEGNYGSVNKNDNGALSIGKVQWHGPRALALMQTVVKANLMQAQNTLGLPLYNEILGAKSDAWNTRVVNADEAAKISKLLTTTEGVAAQDALAATDITSYVNKGMSYGLKDCGALIYFSDGVNQYGTNSSLWKDIAAAALKGAGDVAAMFEATKKLTDKYLTRREKVYKAVLALKV